MGDHSLSRSEAPMPQNPCPSYGFTTFWSSGRHPATTSKDGLRSLCLRLIAAARDTFRMYSSTMLSGRLCFGRPSKHVLHSLGSCHIRHTDVSSNLYASGSLIHPIRCRQGFWRQSSTALACMKIPTKVLNTLLPHSGGALRHVNHIFICISPFSNTQDMYAI